MDRLPSKIDKLQRNMQKKPGQRKKYVITHFKEKLNSRLTKFFFLLFEYTVAMKISAFYNSLNQSKDSK